jgi:hypothetical protein
MRMNFLLTAKPPSNVQVYPTLPDYQKEIAADKKGSFK